MSDPTDTTPLAGDGSGLPVAGTVPMQGARGPDTARIRAGRPRQDYRDLDKTTAALIIANGAAAMGRKVTTFFTFWGLNILCKPTKVQMAKGALERSFAP